MSRANPAVMRVAILLWIASGLLMGLNIFAGLTANRPLILFGLALTGVFALVGIAFGIWAGILVARRVPEPRTRRYR
jgi:membrane associated rhomboid family serine protease